jgi:hypothetical protein
MSGDDTGNGGAAKTFTQADVDRIVSERVARERAKYPDYDELKAKAADADKTKSKLDKMAEQVEAITKRAETAEIETARHRVAEKLGLTAKEAKRLNGKTYEELLSDGNELVEDLEIDVEARKKGKGETGRKPAGDADNEGDGDSGATDDDGNDEQQQAAPTRQRRARPTEDLRPGGTVPKGSTEETDPLKLVAAIPRR